MNALLAILGLALATLAAVMQASQVATSGRPIGPHSHDSTVGRTYTAMIPLGFAAVAVTILAEALF